MRTETDLRDAFAALAESAPDATRVAERLQYGSTSDRHTSGRSEVRRRTPRPRVLVVAFACLALLAALVPLVLGRQTTEPADLRAPGYWSFVSRVDTPPTWVVSRRGIEGNREYTVLGPDQERQQLCEVDVYGRGGYRGPQPAGEPVTVGGRSATYVTGSETDSARLMWRYADDAWVTIGCESASATDNRRWSEELLTRLAFTPTVARLAFRLTDLPTGFTVRSLVLTTDEEGAPMGAVLLSSGRGAISVVNSTRPLDPPGPGLPAPEMLTLQRHPAEYRQDQQVLTITVGAGSVGVYDGNRSELLEVGDLLRFASDVGDPDTWFDARRALP